MPKIELTDDSNYGGNLLSTLSALLILSKEVYPREVHELIIEHLQILKSSFRKYSLSFRRRTQIK